MVASTHPFTLQASKGRRQGCGCPEVEVASLGLSGAAPAPGSETSGLEGQSDVLIAPKLLAADGCEIKEQRCAEPLVYSVRSEATMLVSVVAMQQLREPPKADSVMRQHQRQMHLSLKQTPCGHSIQADLEVQYFTSLQLPCLFLLTVLLLLLMLSTLLYFTFWYPAGTAPSNRCCCLKSKRKCTV